MVQTEFQKELNNCPECMEERNETVALASSPPEFHGGGYMTRTVECGSCGWSGVEEWVIDKTISD